MCSTKAARPGGRCETSSGVKKYLLYLFFREVAKDCLCRIWHMAEIRWDQCQGTKRRPCARWKLCAKCNDLTARRAQARIMQTIDILEIAAEDVYALTVTLPGSRHGIRRASIWSQYAWITGRQQITGRGGLWPMRGLNARMLESGVAGGWHFVECTFNSATKCWNMHLHCLLLGGRPTWLPLSDHEVDADFNRRLKSSTSTKLGAMGFGTRYTLDRCQDVGDVVSYCVALAYSSKQALKGPATRLQSFLRSVKPRLARPFGCARLSQMDRIQYHLENDNPEFADYLLSKGGDLNEANMVDG